MHACVRKVHVGCIYVCMYVYGNKVQDPWECTYDILSFLPLIGRGSILR